MDTVQDPQQTFETLNLDPSILKGIRSIGFVSPTPIQARAIPEIMGGKDVIGIAQTGSGKTAAFVLPILHRLMSRPRPRPGIRALILAPTRELALQSSEHLQKLSGYVPLRGEAIFGGVSMHPQIRALSQGLDIVSATPGRLLDHTYEGRIDYGAVEILVLDEADRMLDMGFIPDVRRIISFLPPKRQNLIFSATMPDEVLKLVRDICQDPVKIQIGVRQTSAVGIRHAVYPVPEPQKTELLLKLLYEQGEKMSSVIVFARTKLRTAKLAKQLERAGVKVSVIHGDLDQGQRLRSMEYFREGRTQVLVATDVAARGIDISDITHVINFDVPQTPEDYIHRSGRTARAGATGDAFTLMSHEEERYFHEIEKVLNQSVPRVTLPNFAYQKHAAAHPRPHAHEGHRGSSHGRRDQHAHPRRPSRPGHFRSGSSGRPDRSRHGHGPGHGSGTSHRHSS